MLLASKLAHVLYQRCLQVFFLKITWTFLLSSVPVYTDKDQWLAVMSTGFLLNNRLELDDAIVWRGPKKNGKPYLILYALYLYLFYLPWPVQAC